MVMGRSRERRQRRTVRPQEGAIEPRRVREALEAAAERRERERRPDKFEVRVLDLHRVALGRELGRRDTRRRALHRVLLLRRWLRRTVMRVAARRHESERRHRWFGASFADPEPERSAI